MKIAVTADVHLRSGEEHPERYRALKNILEQVELEGIQALIIAGDLFDKDYRNYSEFENLCQKTPTLQLHIIPGNHDPDISERSVTGENIQVYVKPSKIDCVDSEILLIPFHANATMGEKITEALGTGGEKPWALVGHGDYMAGARYATSNEPGTYMPLLRRDLNEFRPRVVFLGHIHKPIIQENVHYMGSPCGLEINETGKRRFLVYDTAEGRVEERTVSTDVLFFNESFFVVPLENETLRLKDQIVQRIKSWKIEPSERTKVRLRVAVRGYAMDKSAIVAAVQEGFDGFHFYKDEGPRLDDLSTSKDHQLSAIAERAKALGDKLGWDFGGDEPDKDEVLAAALAAIYGD